MSAHNGTVRFAVVGLSGKPDRDSHRVAKYLQSRGYKIIPVNPNLRGPVHGVATNAAAIEWRERPRPRTIGVQLEFRY